MDGSKAKYNGQMANIFSSSETVVIPAKSTFPFQYSHSVDTFLSSESGENRSHIFETKIEVNSILENDNPYITYICDFSVSIKYNDENLTDDYHIIHLLGFDTDRFVFFNYNPEFPDSYDETMKVDIKKGVESNNKKNTIVINEIISSNYDMIHPVIKSNSSIMK
ncbi:MAG: hypothetical protein GY756_16435 [bacterium]|nr:hypothetical protein [bacterium]